MTKKILIPLTFTGGGNLSITSNELPKMEKSFIKTSMHFSTEPYKIANIHLSKVASALHNPKGILLYARTPKSLVKGV